MKNWQGIPTVVVPRDNRMLAFCTELLNYIIAFATQAGIIKHLTVELVVSCLQI